MIKCQDSEVIFGCFLGVDSCKSGKNIKGLVSEALSGCDSWSSQPELLNLILKGRWGEYYIVELNINDSGQSGVSKGKAYLAVEDIEPELS